MSTCKKGERKGNLNKYKYFNVAYPSWIKKEENKSITWHAIKGHYHKKDPYKEKWKEQKKTKAHINGECKK